MAIPAWATAGYLKEGLDLFMGYMYDGNLDSGEGGRPLQESISMDFQYYYYDDDTYKTTGPLTGHLNAVGEYFTATAPTFDIGEEYGTVRGFSVGQSSLSGGRYWIYVTALGDNAKYRVSTEYAGTIPYDQWPNQVKIYYTQIPTVRSHNTWSLVSPTPTDLIGGVTSAADGHIITNVQRISVMPYGGTDVLYIPIDPDTVYTYDELVVILQQWLSDEMPDADPDEVIPSFEDVSGQEPTEPPCCPDFTLNYDEILSEQELESILNQETYDIPELDTDFSGMTLPSDTYQEETLDDELGQIVGFFPDAVATGFDLLSAYGILNILVNVAIIATLWKLIRGDK